MPLSTKHTMTISQWFMKHSPQAQVVNSNATVAPRNRDFQRQLDAACENWAIRGLRGNMKTPVDIFSTILMGGMEAGIRAVVDEVHNIFGKLDEYKIERLSNANRQQRNQNRQHLHRLTAAVFDYCLQSNGFILQDSSDYMVCMEYERSRDQAMYPNFTHAWLCFRDSFVVQTIPNCYISISLREAGRQPHCGFIRRGVRDFLPGQIEVIEGIIDNPVECADASMVTQCHNPISKKTDVFSPNE